MPTLLLVRHGRTSANVDGILAGRTPGVTLDDTGTVQAAAMAARLTSTTIDEIVSSPLERCQQTAGALTASRSVELVTAPEISECDYGDWTGGKLMELAGDKLFGIVQQQPSAVTFPGGESMLAMQTRATQFVRAHDRRVREEHGADAVWVAVSHGDIIKAILADALGMHFDAFQRIAVDPASVSVIRYSKARPTVLAMNTTAGDLAWVRPAPRKVDDVGDSRVTGDAAYGVGGGSGTQVHPDHVHPDQEAPA